MVLKAALSAYRCSQARVGATDGSVTSKTYEGALKKCRNLSRLRLVPYEAPLTDSKRRARLLRTPNLPPVPPVKVGSKPQYRG